MQPWNAAVQTLIDLQAQYKLQLDDMPDAHHPSQMVRELQEICRRNLRKLRVE